MAHPFKGSSARILRISMSRVRWTRSAGLLTESPLGYRVRLIRLHSVSKGSEFKSVFFRRNPLTPGIERWHGVGSWSFPSSPGRVFQQLLEVLLPDCRPGV